MGPIRLGHVEHSEAAIRRAVELLRAGATTEAGETAALARELESALGYRRAIVCSSGTAALWLIFSCMPRGAVTTTPLTYAATANAPESLGFSVRYRDITLRNYGLDPRKMTPDDDQAVKLTVHLLGYPSDVRGDVSDAAEAVGSALPKPRYAAAISFYPSHTVGVGELGAVLTDDGRLAAEAALAKDNGRDRASREPFRRLRLGLNFRASEVTAALARYQLRKMKSIAAARRENAKAYTDLLDDKIAKVGPYDRRCSYLGYPVVFRQSWLRREAGIRLAEAGVEYRNMFPLLGGFDSCPNAGWVSNCGLYVPCHQGLSDADVHRVAEALLG